MMQFVFCTPCLSVMAEPYLAHLHCSVIHFLVFLCSVSVITSCDYGLESMPGHTFYVNSSGYNAISKEKLLLFDSFQTVMQFFNDPKYRDLQETKRVIYEFNTKCLANFYDMPIKGRTRKPFIVIEGNQRTSRKIIGRRISRRLGGTYLSNPPTCLVKLTHMFPFGSVLRRCYFGLCMYATARRVTWLYNRWPAILNGYYYDQASFSIAQVFANTSLPAAGHPVYAWPRDLLKPDLIFYIDFPDNLHSEPATTRHPSSWKPRMMKVYETLNDSSIVFVNTKKGLDFVEDFVLDTIVERLSNKLDFSICKRGQVPTIQPRHLRNHRNCVP